MDDVQQLRELEARLADLKARLPAHTVRPAMIMELEELEEQIAETRARVKMRTGDAEGAA